jgi:hypothetical protein
MRTQCGANDFSAVCAMRGMWNRGAEDGR